MTEQEAVACLKRGDISGLRALVYRYQVQAVRTAFLITRDEALAQEVVQEVFLRVYDRIEQFDATRPFAPWFFRIVANEAIKVSRKNRRHLSLEWPVAKDKSPLSELLADIRPGPDDRVAAKMRREKVWEALGRLTPKQRAAVVLRYYLDMGETEMSGHLNIAPGTVKWRLHAARKQLRLLLNKE